MHKRTNAQTHKCTHMNFPAWQHLQSPVTKNNTDKTKNHFLLSVRSPRWSKVFCATYFGEFEVKEVKERVVDKAGFKLVFVNCRRVRASQLKKAVEEYNIQVAQQEKIFWAGTSEEENIRTGEDGRSLRNSAAFKILMKRDDSYFEWSDVPPRKKRNTLSLLDSTLAAPFKNPMDSFKRSPKLVFPSFNEDEIYKSLDVEPRSPRDKTGSRKCKAYGKRAREQEYSTESGSDHSTESPLNYNTESESEEDRERSSGIKELVRGMRLFEQRALPSPSSPRVNAEDNAAGERAEDEDHQDRELRAEDEDRQDPELRAEDEDRQDRELRAEDEDRQDRELRAEDEDRQDRELRADDDGFHAHIREIAPGPVAAGGDMVSLLNLGSMITPLLQSNTTLQNALIASNEKLLACKDEIIAVKDLLLTAKDNVIAARDELIAAKNELIRAQSIRLQE